jgi:hypothetical protein
MDLKNLFLNYYYLLRFNFLIWWFTYLYLKIKMLEFIVYYQSGKIIIFNQLFQINLLKKIWSSIIKIAH